LDALIKEKKIIMKKILILIISIIAVGLTGCLKDQFGTDLYATGQPILEFEWPQGGGGNTIGTGLQYFSGGALLYPQTDLADTTFFIVNLASTNTINKPIDVTISVDPSALQANFSTDSITYLPLPDSTYKILTPTGTIPAGQRQDTFYIVFYPSKLDVTKSYGLPITMTDAQSIPISSNFGHIYIHTIGNPISGLYDQEWIRWNSADTTGAPAYDIDFGDAVFAPITETKISVSDASGTGETDFISFVNTAGVLSNFQVSIGLVTGITEGTPVLQVADPVNGIYRIFFPYVNGSGAARSIVLVYRKD
jgi:hypothetical protein